MMTKAPEFIQLGALVVPVTVTRLTDATFGEAEVHPAPAIAIDDRLGNREQASTLIHEIIEVIGMAYSLELNETQVCCLEQGLVSALTQTPELLPYLQRSLQGR